VNTTSNPVGEAATDFSETPVFEGLARLGYVARGVIYGLIGILAIRIAQGFGGPKPNQQGAMRTIADQTFGHALLVVLAIGLAGYAIWRLLQAGVGHTPEAGHHSAAERLGALGSGLAYAGFALLAVGILSGSSSSSKTKPSKTTHDVFGWPGGRWLVAIAGLVFIGIACYQAYLGLSRRFLKYSKTEDMGPGVKKAFTAIGATGLVARGVAFLLIGIFLVKAAIDYKAKEAVGIDGALLRLTNHSYGTVALVVVAIGLIAFGLYSVADSRYRRI
jgi:hypothetical protein